MFSQESNLLQLLEVELPFLPDRLTYFYTILLTSTLSCWLTSLLIILVQTKRAIRKPRVITRRMIIIVVHTPPVSSMLYSSWFYLIKLMHYPGGLSRESHMASKTYGALKSPQKLRSLMVTSGKKQMPASLDSWYDQRRIFGFLSIILVISASELVLTLLMVASDSPSSLMLEYEQSAISFCSTQMLWSNLAIYLHHNYLSCPFLISSQRKCYLSCSQMRSDPLGSGISGLSDFSTFLQYFYIRIPRQSSLLQIQS